MAAIVAAYVGSPLTLLFVCREWQAIRGADSGLGFELLQTVAVMLVSCTLALVPFTQARRSTAMHVVCWTPVAAGLIFRAIDWVVYYQSGLHINMMVTSHAHGSALWLVLGSVPFAQLMLPLIALLYALLLARWSFARVGTSALSPLRLLGCSCLLLAAIYCAAANATQPNVEHATTGPEWTTYRSWRLATRERTCLRDLACAETMNQLDEMIRRKLTRFGMRIDPQAEMPLRKPTVYTQDLPFPSARPRGATPNVIVVFMESMSAFFVNDYHPRFPSITPELDAFAAESMRVDNYYNATTPTVTSLVAALCSIHPPSGHDEFGAPFFGALRCAADTLAPHGYHSTFIRGIEKEFANVGNFLESQQFEVRDKTDIHAELDEEPQSWGYSDHQLFRYLTKVLEHQIADRPFFVGMTTVDLHPPFDLTPVPEIISGEAGRILNIVHSTDHAFGTFWRWFKQSRFADDTIVIVTADHAVLPKPEYAQLRGPAWEKTFYDRIPLFIHDPCVDLPRTFRPEIANSVDLLPTILHLLGINESNPFEGMSLFDDRRAKRGILGDHAYLFFSSQLDHRGQRIVDNFNLGDCVPGSAPISELLTRCEQQRWHEWKLRLIDQRRVWRTAPAVDYAAEAPATKEPSSEGS